MLGFRTQVRTVNFGLIARMSYFMAREGLIFQLDIFSSGPRALEGCLNGIARGFLSCSWSVGYYSCRVHVGACVCKWLPHSRVSRYLAVGVLGGFMVFDGVRGPGGGRITHCSKEGGHLVGLSGHGSRRGGGGGVSLPSKGG